MVVVWIVIDQYLGVVKPMYHQFIEPTKRYADIVIPEVSNTVAIDLLTTKIAKILERSSNQQNNQMRRAMPPFYFPLISVGQNGDFSGIFFRYNNTHGRTRKMNSRWRWKSIYR